MGNAAHGFYTELKSRRKSLNCNSEHDLSRRDNAKDPLLIALNVELQQTTEDKKPDDT